ncbi:MAG TPA: hypothetical protein VN892_08780 [Solirubrobacteraceae bacterium]|nr:hypothetical protein [Solirubrobacteraceae bacterium]
MLAPTTTTDSSAAASNETGQLIEGVFEPPSGLVLTALSRNKLIVCVLAVALALAGTAYGLSRQTTYTASATLQVGQVNPNSPGFYSYVASAAALATAFSRAIAAEPVLATVHQQLKLAPSQAVARLSAEPLPLSPAFRVIATGPTESSATQLANVTANALIAYESQANSANPEAESLLHEYRVASLNLQAAIANLERVEQASGTTHSSSNVFTAKAERATATARLTAVGDAYTAAIASQAPRSGLVTLVAGATSASNNRHSKVAILTLIGLLAGILLGAITAILLEQHRHHTPHTTKADLETLHTAPT